jgi:predicted Holliday junction resolvase-like endonuclease
MDDILFFVIVGIFVLAFYYLWKKLHSLELENLSIKNRLENQNTIAIKNFNEVFMNSTNKIKNFIFNEVIPGNIMASMRTKFSKELIEKFVPFSEKFRTLGYNPLDAKFLGQPIDYIVFEGLSKDKIDKIAFVEIKSGKSPLSSHEKDIKEIIQPDQILEVKNTGTNSYIEES